MKTYSTGGTRRGLTAVLSAFIVVVGLGLLGFQSSKNIFPAAGTFKEAGTPAPATADLSAIYKSCFGATPTFAATGTTPTALYNWVVDILPYLDNSDLYNAYNRSRLYYDTGAARTLCPRRPYVRSTGPSHEQSAPRRSREARRHALRPTAHAPRPTGGRRTRRGAR